MCAAGDIVSGGQAGSVFVLVTAVERFGTNQTLLLLVKVTLCIYITTATCSYVLYSGDNSRL